MNSNVQVFDFNNLQVRTVLIDNEPWFVAKDVCSVLEIDSSQTRRLDEDEKGLHSIQTLGGMQNTQVVNEPGLYSLIYGSRKPEAKQFKRWINHEVIPSIRKHGGYLTPTKLEEVLLNPDTLIQLATNLKDERTKREQLQLQIEMDKPKVIFAEALETSEDSILVADMSKLLKQNGIEVGEKRLFEWLRQNGYLIKGGNERNMPTQRSMELEIMEIKVGQRLSISQGSKITRTPKITGKGQVYFINKFKAV